MGSDYCQIRRDLIPTVTPTSRNQLTSSFRSEDKYDILCLQELPKYDRSQQKATADKFINDFVLKYKYAIVRKEGTNIAILSKFPIRKSG
jgi:exonuclease III